MVRGVNKIWIMKRPVWRPLIAAFICSVTLFIWLGGCGHGPGNTLTLQGQVEDAYFSAFDNETGAQFTAPGTGSGLLKSFTLGVPNAASYQFFVTENQGTSFERQVQVFVNGSDVFSVSQPGYISLGFINTVNGIALPAISAGDLAAAGVKTSSGLANVLPPGFENAFVTNDLSGVWNVHGLNAEGLWFHDSADIAGPAASFGNFITNGTLINGTTISLNVMVSGVVNSPDLPAFNGCIGHLKDTIMATSTSLVNSGSNQLFIAQKTNPGGYKISSLAGAWQAQGVISGPLFKGWVQGAMTFDSFGNVISAALVRSDSTIINAPTGLASISASGEVTVSGYPSFDGSINTGETVIAATMTDSLGDPILLIIQKRTLPAMSAQSAAGLAGAWNVHDISVDSSGGWDYGKAFIDTSGNVLLYRVSPSGNTNESFILGIDSDGDLENFQNFPGLVAGAGGFLGPLDDLFALVFSFTRGASVENTFLLMQK